jgi:Derlin-2/3
VNKLTAGVYLQGAVLLAPLTLALAYTFAQDNPRRMTGFFILNFEAKFLPWVLLFVTFILSGPQGALFQGTGLIAAHLYEFLTRIWPELGGGRQWVQTPGFIRRAFGGDQRVPQARDHGTAFAARSADTPAQGRTTGFGGAGWNTRGPGRRLGQ